MVLGSCPYEGCDGALMLASPEKMPVYERHQCEDCGGWIWTLHSRIEPWSLPEDEFLKRYSVDGKTRVIVKRPSTESPAS
jgi:hypothetical protein